MKKKILSALMLGFLFFGMKTSVNAKIVLEEEIPNGTYVIGNYIFQRFAPVEKRDYEGVLRTTHIMLASNKSSDDSFDSTIYYKNLFGEWIDGLTNEKVSIPKYFEIKSIDLREITNTPRLECSVSFITPYVPVCISTYIDQYGIFNYSDTKGNYSDTTLPDRQQSLFYIIKDADGKIATDQNVRYENGKFYGDDDRELHAVIDKNAEFINSSHTLTSTDATPGEIFYVVSKSFSGRTYYSYQEAGAYDDDDSEFSNIVKISEDSKDVTKIDEYSLTVNVNKETDLGKYYYNNAKFNVYNAGSGVGREGVGSNINYRNANYNAHIKSFEIYSNNKIKDIIGVDGDEDNPSLNALKYSQVHRFANIDFDAYLVAESGNLVADSDTGIYQERAFLKRINPSEQMKFFARILICNKAEDECSYYMTNIMNLEKTLQDARYGDLNLDGTIDATDLDSYSDSFIGMKDRAIKSGEQWMNADLNNDGFVNYIDELILKQYLNGKYNDILPSKHVTDYAIYGDINEDGSITYTDLNQLTKYLNSKSNQSLTEQEYKNADVNADGKVDYIDALFLTYYLADWSEFKNTFPIKAFTEYTLYGDVNNNGLIDGDDLVYLKNYLNNKLELSAQSLKNADANGDGTIDQTDYDLISKNLNNYIAGDLTKPNYASLTPLTESSIVYGDINDDGSITYSDLIQLLKYLSAVYNSQITGIGYKNADINNDSKVDYVDAALLANHIASSESETKEPIAAPITEYTLYGDVDNNGLIDGNDLVYLKNYLDNKLELSAQSLKNADANGDGTIDQTDYDLISKNINAYITGGSTNNPNLASLTPLS